MNGLRGLIMSTVLSAEGYPPPPKKGEGFLASDGEALVLEFWESVEHSFIAITPRPTLTRNGSPAMGPNRYKLFRK